MPDEKQWVVIVPLYKGNDMMDDRHRIFLRAAGVMLLVAVPPIWPYGYYIFLRLVVCGVAFYIAFHLRENNQKYCVTLVIMGLLFNPILPIFLPKLIWIPIDIGGAILFFILAKKT